MARKALPGKSQRTASTRTAQLVASCAAMRDRPKYYIHQPDTPDGMDDTVPNASLPIPSDRMFPAVLELGLALAALVGALLLFFIF